MLAQLAGKWVNGVARRADQCQRRAMASHFHSAAPLDAAPSSDGSLRAALLESLYCDMLVLADEVRAGPAPEDMAADPQLRVRVACESLRLSARLMRMTQLLLDHRAGLAVPPGVEDMLTRPLAEDALPAALCDQLDGAARLECRLAELVAPPPPLPSPALGLQSKLAQHFG